MQDSFYLDSFFFILRMLYLDFPSAAEYLKYVIFLILEVKAVPLVYIWIGSALKALQKPSPVSPEYTALAKNKYLLTTPSPALRKVHPQQ